MNGQSFWVRAVGIKGQKAHDVVPSCHLCPDSFFLIRIPTHEILGGWDRNRRELHRTRRSGLTAHTPQRTPATSDRDAADCLASPGARRRMRIHN